ncbi:MAG: hydantoinase/oxoprolinase family protein [Planctomycetota bacterium]
MTPTIGIDTGGTFTDLVYEDESGRHLVKVPSTPEDPSLAVADALERLGHAGRAAPIVHGTTVALNALLTGSVARTALVTNRGFADLLELGRQERPDLYALEPETTVPLVPRGLRFELGERAWPNAQDGTLEVVERADAEELAALVQRLAAERVESIAVCLLHSWKDPEPELRVARALGSLGVPVTCSADLLREHREVERFSTAVVNAALAPRMRAYLGALERRTSGRELALLQSSGGTLDAARAREEPVRVLLSGPAGGVVGAARAAREAGFDAFASLDVGGTSSDVAFGRASGEPVAKRATDPVRVAGHAIAVPTLDVHTIGCGGGSLVHVDAGGVLHVGPKSAGADPGPLAYGRGDTPTVTDAHVRLGHIAEGAFLGRALPLDIDRVHRGFERLGARLGVAPIEAARAVLDVTRAQTRRAVGVMTMQRGVDPASLPLVAFGGAGGLHAAATAASLRMRAALVPAAPGALSALGLAVAAPHRDHARAVLEPLAAWSTKELDTAWCQLVEAGRAELAGRELVFERALDLRYRGQSFELRLPASDDPAAAFHRAHRELYGYALEGRAIELVTLRARARVAVDERTFAQPRVHALPASAIIGERQVYFAAPRAECITPIIDRARLTAGIVFDGPALVEEYSGTSLVPPGWHASMTVGDHLLLMP